jgi:hypothetical protein
MSNRFGAFLVMVLIGASLMGSSSASAATEFGDPCVADEVTESGPVTLFEISAAANPLPPAAPSAGVITKWKVNVIPVPASIQETLKILRLDAGAKSAQIIAEDPRTVFGGSNSFDVRIPVQAGDRLATFGPSEFGTLYCETTDINAIAGFAGGGGGVGASATYSELPIMARIPVFATLEPDADNDGFGDETQDGCPQSAAIQTECPVVIVDSFALRQKNSIVVLVSTSTAAPVTVSGTAKLPKGGKKASSSAKAKLKKLTKNVPSGKLVRFKLKLPGSLKSALASLPRGKSITVKLQANATNVAGQVSKDKSKLKLKGGS